MDLISVLIPVYKVEKYLPKCLDSICRQTYTNIEIICVNDGSPDNCLAILEKYQMQDSRIQIINKKNGGLPSARNAGLDVAQGKYICFVDSDDYIEKNMVEKLYRASQKYNSEIVICGANIFPKDKEADWWIKASLTPQDNHYPKFEPNILFKESGAIPFIWRTFIKKELIDRINFRLDESIHIGEDLAAQFRLYPEAQGITMISDKLYNYQWYRTDSLMNTLVYENISKKVEAHIKLVEHIGQVWTKTKTIRGNEVDLLEWSIKFIYEDFISLSEQEKINFAPILISTWEACGYYMVQGNISQHINDMFNYCTKFLDRQFMEPKVTFVLWTNWSCTYLERAIKSIKEQSIESKEIICINNGMPANKYRLFFEYLNQDLQVRVFNQPPTDISTLLNMAVFYANGKYIKFMDPDDYLLDAYSITEWINYTEKNKFDFSQCQSGSKESYFEKVQTDKNLNIDRLDLIREGFKSTLFKTKFLTNNNVIFKEYSLLTSELFMLKCLNLTDKFGMIDNPLYVNSRMHKLDWISTKECKNLLKGLLVGLKFSKRTSNSELHRYFVSKFYSNFYFKLITNSSLGFKGNIKEFPKGENSQVEIWIRLLAITQTIDYDLINEEDPTIKAIPPIVIEFIERRTHFLNSIL